MGSATVPVAVLGVPPGTSERLAKTPAAATGAVRAPLHLNADGLAIRSARVDLILFIRELRECSRMVFNSCPFAQFADTL